VAYVLREAGQEILKWTDESEHQTEGMNMSFERYKDWLDEALDDLSSAEIMFREGKFSKACFLSQQAAEKVVKALMIFKFKKYDDIHSVSELLRRVHAESNLVEDGEKLDRFYIPTRYPNAWPLGAPYAHYTRLDAEEAMEGARRIVEYAIKQIKGSR
jgi:HEPN domain-containing protein